MRDQGSNCPFLLCIGGLPGSGKTHYRNSEPVLKSLPHVDIADVYRENPNLDWEAVFELFCQQVVAKIENGQGLNGLVMEALFRRKDLIPIEVVRTQRHKIEELARSKGCRILFIWMHAPVHVCKERVESDTRYGVELRKIRLEIIDSADPSEFEEYSGEEAMDVVRRLTTKVASADRLGECGLELNRHDR